MLTFDLLERNWYSDLFCQINALKTDCLTKIAVSREPIHPHNLDPLLQVDINKLLQIEAEKYAHETFLKKMEGKQEKRFWVRKVEFGSASEPVKMEDPKISFDKSVKMLGGKIMGVDSSFARIRYVQGDFVLMSSAATLHNYEKYDISVHSLAQFFIFNANIAEQCPQISVVNPMEIGQEIYTLMYKFEMQTLLKHAKPGMIAFKCGSLRSHSSIPLELEIAVKKRVIPVGVVKNPYSKLIISSYDEDFDGDFTSDAAAFQEILKPGERSKWFLVARPGTVGQLLVVYYKPPLLFNGYDPPVCRLEILPNHFVFAELIVEAYAMGVLVASDPAEPTCAWINVSEEIARTLIPNLEEVSTFIEEKKIASLIPSFNTLRGINSSIAIEEGIKWIV